MAQAQPLYSIEDQYAKLSTDLPFGYPTLNLFRMRLLLACSQNGNLDAAKNRFLFLIQDTEVRTIFSSILEIPLERILNGVSTLQQIHGAFQSYYAKFPDALRELKVLGVPQSTRVMFERYFEGNDDPVYKLSIIPSMVMMAYIKDDQINNRKE